VAKVKGTILVSAVKLLRRNRERARELLAPRLQHYLEERIVVSSWYPAEDLIELVRACGRVLGQTGPAFFEAAGRISASEHAEGVYAHLFTQESDPNVFARRAFALWSSMHDSGTLKLELLGPGKARVSVHGYEIPSRDLCGTVQGYVAQTFELAGQRAVRVRKLCCCVDGAPTCAWDVSYAV
jgi:hypothetical protein